MNLKKSYRIIDARRGDVRKPSRIRDNGWRPHSGRQVYQVGRDLHFEKEFADRDEAIAHARRLHEDTHDRTYVKYGYESDWGLDGQERIWNSDTDYVGDSARVNDMAIRDMAVRNEKAINNAAIARNSDFVANNMWIYNLTTDPNAQVVVDAVDFFDTVEHLVKQGYNDWVNDAIEECRKAVDLGVDRAKRTLYIWGYKRVDVRGVPIVDVRIEYTPDKLQLRLWDNHAAIGGDASNEEMGEFIKLFNTLTCVNDEEPDERITAFTEQFFGMVEGEFGSSEIEDSARVSDMAVHFKEGIDAVAEDWKSAFTKKHPELQNIFNEKENAVDFFDTARYLVSKGQEEELQRELNELGRQYRVYCNWKWFTAEKESDCCLEIAKAGGGDDRLFYYPYTDSLVCYGATFDSLSNDRQLNRFQRNYESMKMESPDAQLINFLDEFFDWAANNYGTNEVAQ